MYSQLMMHGQKNIKLRLFKTACDVCLVALAVVMWSWDCAHCLCPSSTQPQQAQPGKHDMQS